MARKSNKTKYIESIFQEIEHSTDPEIKDIYICLLKEKLDGISKDYKLLMYDEIKSTLEQLYDIFTKLNIKDQDHTVVLGEIKAILGQQYWSMYKEALFKETVI